MDLKQGDLENIILNALWDLESEEVEKIYVGDIQERIKSPKKKWAYTTVKTVLDRLVDKEIAVREKDGKKYLYRSVVNRSDAGRMAIEKVMRQYFKNDVTQLLECLKSEDIMESIDSPTERDKAAQQLKETQKALAARQ